jgi:hypothetical protein
MLLAALRLAGVTWALLAGAACAQESQQELMEMLDDSVAYLSERLPFHVDLTTRLIAVSREGRTLVYQYEVERLSLRALEGHGAVLGRRTCSNRQLFNLMSIGGAVRYSYELMQSGQQVVHEITLDDCVGNEIAL